MQEKSGPSAHEINIKNNFFLKKIIDTQSLLTESEFDLDAFMKLVVDQMHLLTPASGAVVELVEGDEMVYRAATGTVASHIGLRLKIENSISGLCVQLNKVLYCEDTEVDPRVNLEACRKVCARSLVVAPLVYKGHTVGVLKILSKEPQNFNETDVQTLQLMAGFIASGLAHQLAFEANNQLLQERTHMLEELKAAQARLHQLAHYDYLTELANRRTFIDSLVKSIEKSKRNLNYIALLYLDIDHFKDINDNLGHDVGDALLKAFATRLKLCVRSYDLVARLGGDEFIILIDQMAQREDVIAVAKKIQKIMQREFKLKNQQLKITASIGVSFDKGGTLSMDELIKHGDLALYQAKKSGRNTFKIYNEAQL